MTSFSKQQAKKTLEKRATKKLGSLEGLEVSFQDPTWPDPSSRPFLRIIVREKNRIVFLAEHEFVEVETSEFVRAHGHEPKGTGFWAFTVSGPSGEHFSINAPGPSSFSKALRYVLGLERVRGKTVRVCP
jgi:hypothetical protein